jgi:GT2 family glycosyltransferase
MSLRRAPNVFLLNSDAVVHPGALKAMLEYLEANPSTGVIGHKVLNPDGSLQFSCRRFPNPVAALFRNTPIGKLFPNNRFTRDYLMQDLEHDHPRKVDWVSGCAMLASRKALETLGGLDPEFFMYLEDVDFCWRCWQAGLEVVYLPGGVVTHAIVRSTDKAPNRMIGRFHKSMLLFYRKNMLPRAPAPLRPVAYLGALAAVGLRAGMFIAKNKIDDIKRRRAA